MASTKSTARRRLQRLNKSGWRPVTRITSWLCISFVCGSAPGVFQHAVAGVERTLDDAVYSRAQARAGKKLYEQHCLTCHERGYFRQILRSRAGETLEPLFEAMVSLMPQNAPGSLADDEYLDVLAYIIAQARYAGGEEKLRLAELNAVRIPENSAAGTPRD